MNGHPVEVTKVKTEIESEDELCEVEFEEKRLRGHRSHGIRMLD